MVRCQMQGECFYAECQEGHIRKLQEGPEASEALQQRLLAPCGRVQTAAASTSQSKRHHSSPVNSDNWI
jgi:hypothetical protein